MYRLLIASFNVIRWQFPSRSFLRGIPLRDAVSLYLIISALSLLTLFLPTPFPEESGLDQVLPTVVTHIISLAVMLFGGQWLLNRYASERFSLTEVFTLQALLTSGSALIFNASLIPAAVIGEIGLAVVGIVIFVFGLYMLLVFQKAISDIAGITKSQAAITIVVPIVVLFIGGFVVATVLGPIPA